MTSFYVKSLCLSWSRGGQFPSLRALSRIPGSQLRCVLCSGLALSVAFVAVFVYRLCTLVHLQYRPSEETLQQIDRFCISTIADCDISPNRRSSPWSRSLSQQSGASTSSTTISPSLPVSTFASGTLVKSLNYIRSLVARHIPKRSFQPAAFAGAASASRQSLPSLSSLLIDGGEDVEYIALDVLQWRWPGEQQSSMVSSDSDRVVNPQDMGTHSFLEVGAAALLVGDMEAKMKGQPWSHFRTAEMPHVDQLLQPSSVTTATNSVSARPT
ncbi:hypothetical protein CK203_010264 [Vitis vinifera]|uniref:Uncharacterized protein n=1 Tax=Vitis vinifera TaxID=29760 RepID=A0A438JY91_VITVI|nr:hypothetical protein CK203_010264 [Vitis vinifera]